jgi:hypothetical protein
VTTLSEVAWRVGYAIRTHPWVRILVGAVLIAVGILELVVGAGHGRIIAFGVLLVVGSVVAGRSRRLPDSDGDEKNPPSPPSPDADRHTDLP